MKPWGWYWKIWTMRLVACVFLASALATVHVGGSLLLANLIGVIGIIVSEESGRRLR